jgi:hypothetical protein
MQISGKCHCGNISLTLTWASEPSQIPARTCTCSFCIKHGCTWTADPKCKLDVRVRDSARVTKYEFGTRTAQYHICTHCGVVTLATSRIGGRVYGIVTVNALEGVKQSLLSHAQLVFEGETPEIRLARRRSNWIPDVTVTVTAE